MYDRSRHLYNLNHLQLLSQKQKQIIKDKFYKVWKTCQNEMIIGEDLKKITSTRQPIILALKEVMKATGVFNQIEPNYNQYFSQILEELDLKCPTCNRKLEKNAKVGKYIGDDEFWHSLDRIKELPKFSDRDDSQISQSQNKGDKLEDSWGREFKQDLEREKENSKQERTPQKSDSYQVVTEKKPPLYKTLTEQLGGDRDNKYCKNYGEKTVNEAAPIACIDDSKTVQLQVKKTLEWAGYKVLNIVDPGSCMTTLVRHQPKLILMDINMPYFDGYELCQMLQKSRQLKDIPIVIFSSRDTMVNRVRARMCGAIGFISKPIAPLELIDFVNNIVPITPESLLNIYIEQLKGDR